MTRSNQLSYIPIFAFNSQFLRYKSLKLAFSRSEARLKRRASDEKRQIDDFDQKFGGVTGTLTQDLRLAKAAL